MDAGTRFGLERKGTGDIHKTREEEAHPSLIV